MRAPLSWFETNEAHANDQELLLWALLLVHNAETADGLDKWAKSVHTVTEHTAAVELKEHWKPLDIWGQFNSCPSSFRRSSMRQNARGPSPSLRLSPWRCGQRLGIAASTTISMPTNIWTV